jgi:hypothetical protein
MTTSIENLKSVDPFAEADDDGGPGDTKQSQNYVHIRIQRTCTFGRPRLVSVLVNGGAVGPAARHIIAERQADLDIRAQWS